MEDPQQEPDKVTVIRAPGEYAFAGGVEAVRGEHVVYLDFIQRDPHRDGQARAVASIILPTAAVPAVIDALSSVRDPA